jgi:hypothetical protein
MADTDIADQATHVTGLKHVFNQAVIFMHEKGIAVGSNDACGILPPVLQDQQTIVQQLVNWIFTNDTYDSAHGCSLK